MIPPPPPLFASGIQNIFSPKIFSKNFSTIYTNFSQYFPYYNFSTLLLTIPNYFHLLHNYVH